MRMLIVFLLLVIVPGFVTASEVSPLIYYVQADRLEYQEKPGRGLWDLQGWIGGDENKFWWKSEGQWHSGSVADAELQLLYSKAISPFFDLQFGLRRDMEPDPNRTFAVVGVQGLAPQWFEVDAAAYLSDDGDLSARIETEYELLITQRLVLQPRFEINIATSRVSELGLGDGVRSTDLGLRLRYEIRREFAPYLGLNWHRRYGETRDFAQAAGEDSNYVSIVAGARFWF